MTTTTYVQPTMQIAASKQATGDLYDGGRKIIILPGVRVNAEVPNSILHSYSNGMIKAVERSLDRSMPDKDAHDKPNVYCAIYSHRDETTSVREHCLPEQLAGTEFEALSDDANTFVRQTLLPIMGMVDNQPPPGVEAACERLSKLTLVSHSSGTIFAKEVCKAFRAGLEKCGAYSEADMNRICHEVTHIALGNGARIKHSNAFDDKPGFHTIHFESRVDLTVLGVMERMHDWLRSSHPSIALNPHDAYRAAGYDVDAALARQREPADYVHQPSAHASLRTTTCSDGLLIQGDMPGALATASKLGPPIINRQSLTDDFHKLLDELKECGAENLAADGKPLFFDEIVPEHHVPMFLTPTDSGNRAMVEKVDAAIAQAVGREVSHPRIYAGSPGAKTRTV